MEMAWSSIPPDILFLIAGKIISGDDYVRFSAVCRTWHSLAKDFYTNSNHKLNLRPFHVPGTDPGNKRITLRNLASGATFPVDLPETAGTSRCWGSPFGWLIAFDHTDLRLTLFNPFTGAAIPLPPLPLDQSESSQYNAHRSKAFLTASPDSDPDDCHVVFSTPCKLAVARPTSKTWSCFIDNIYDIYNVVYYEHNLYGIQSSPYPRSVKLFVFELTQTLTGRALPVQFITLDLTTHRNKHLDVVNRGLTPRQKNIFVHRHLDVINGELCLRALYYSGDVFSLATTYNLFKIHLFAGNVTRLEQLGNHDLHFGQDYSLSCNARLCSMDVHERNVGSRYGGHICAPDVHNRYIYECLNDYVTYNNQPRSINRAFDVEVWNLLHSLRGDYSPTHMYVLVWRHLKGEDSPTWSLRPFWIFPSIKFVELEDGTINLNS